MPGHRHLGRSLMVRSYRSRYVQVGCGEGRLCLRSHDGPCRAGWLAVGVANLVTGVCFYALYLGTLGWAEEINVIWAVVLMEGTLAILLVRIFLDISYRRWVGPTTRVPSHSTRGGERQPSRCATPLKCANPCVWSVMVGLRHRPWCRWT